jgi:hypothetical protein
VLFRQGEQAQKEAELLEEEGGRLGWVSSPEEQLSVELSVVEVGGLQ